MNKLICMSKTYMQSQPYTDKSPKVQSDQALGIQCLKYATVQKKNHFLKNHKKKYHGIWYESALLYVYED